VGNTPHRFVSDERFAMGRSLVSCDSDVRASMHIKARLGLTEIVNIAPLKV
jgi:hypothetical protein